MSSSHQTVQHGLSYLGDDRSPQTEKIYTHIETSDGVCYQLIEPMTSRQLRRATMARNRLIVKVPMEGDPGAPGNLFRTDHVFSFSDDVRPWIETKTQKYWLVASLEESPK